MLPCSPSSGCFRASSATSSLSSVDVVCSSTTISPTWSVDLVPPFPGALLSSPLRGRYRALSATICTPTPPVLLPMNLTKTLPIELECLSQQGVPPSHPPSLEPPLARPKTVSLTHMAEFGPKAGLVPFPVDVRRYSPLWPAGRLLRMVRSYLASSTPMSLSLTHPFQAHLAQPLAADVTRAHDRVRDRCRTFSIPLPAFPSAKPVAASLLGHSPLDRARITAFSSLVCAANLSFPALVRLYRVNRCLILAQTKHCAHQGSATILTVILLWICYVK